MSVPREPEWDLDPHTVGKHAVLRAYLNAWIPIMGQSKPRVVFIDGFAGPGRYKGGEDGSPIIAMKALIEHQARARVKQMNFLFIEDDEKRYQLLDQRVSELRPSLPEGCVARVHHGTFSGVVTTYLDSLEQSGHKMAPALMMVDPFGVSDVRLDVLGRFLQGQSKELYISFMCEAMQRHVDSPEFETHLDAMFGTTSWRDNPQDADRIERLHGLYERRLRAIGAKFVLRFSVKSGGRHVYTLFFATKHPEGCDRMKQAMWKVAPDGNYTFNGKGLDQLTLNFFEGGVTELDDVILKTFWDKPRVWVSTLEAFVKTDQHRFHSGQLRQSLKRLEASNKITVNESTRSKRGSYPSNCELFFVRP